MSFNPFPAFFVARYGCFIRQNATHGAQFFCVVLGAWIVFAWSMTTAWAYAAEVNYTWRAPASVLDMWEDSDLTEIASHLPHVDPNAPKGGDVRFSAIGTYDSLNPFSPRGVSGARLGLTYETLGEADRGNEFRIHGLLAESFILATDRTAMKVCLRKEARFHDGTPVTAHDVAANLNLVQRVTATEESAKQAHKRLDGLEGNEK